MALGCAALEVIEVVPILRHVSCVVLVHLERLARAHCSHPEALVTMNRSPARPPGRGTSTCPDRQDEAYGHCPALQPREALPNNLAHTMRDDKPMKLIWEVNKHILCGYQNHSRI